MSKKLIVAALIMTTLSMVFVGETQASSSSSTSPLKISVWPGVWTWPDVTVYGLSLGLPASYSDNKDAFVGGLDMAMFLSQTRVKGVQLSMLNMGEGSSGVQMAMANVDVTQFDGVQAGAYNEYKRSEGFQLGLVNRAEKSRGVQIGLVNFMEGGFFPVFPLINFNCKSQPQPAPDASSK